MSDIDERFKNLVAYGTTHPEIYKMPDIREQAFQIWTDYFQRPEDAEIAALDEILALTKDYWTAKHVEAIEQAQYESSTGYLTAEQAVQAIKEAE